MAHSALQFNTNALYQAVTQLTHNFSVGDVLRFDGTEFVLASSFAEATASIVGMVSGIENVDQFYFTEVGLISGITTTPTEGGAYVPGTQYYLSETDGELTSIAPAIEVPCFIAYTATSGFFIAGIGSSGGAFGANTALSNLTATAINRSLVSDSDGIDDLGSESNRWFNLYAERITTGQSAADTFNIGAWDVNAASFVPFITLTANNVPTCLLQDGVEAITQAPGDNSQKVATTEYCEDYLPLAGGTMTGDLILNADPTVALGAATKQYVDAIATGIDIKEPVYAATTGALTATYANGASGVGATLTNSGAQAAFSVDGVSPALNSRILVKNQGSTFENGIYTLTTVGSGASNWVLTRATDFDQAADINSGDLIIVENGTANAATGWLETATVVTMGTDPITFNQFAANTGANAALSNLAGVAINTSLISDTDITDDLGSLAIRWKDIFAQTLSTGDTATDTLKLRGYDVDGAAFVDFLTITANNTPTAVLNGDVTSTTQSFGDSSTKLATTAFTQAARKQVVNAQTLTYTAVSADLGKVILYTGAGGVDLALDSAATLGDGWFATLRNDSAGTITINPNGAETINGAATLAVGAGDGVIIYTNGTLFYTIGEASASSGANTALSNLAAVAINTSLTSDTDITDDLGTQAIRWRNIYASSLQTGDTAADVLNIGAWDVDGAAISNFITLTAGNTPTCALASGVTAVTQSPSDNSTKIATTAYADAIAASGGGLVYLGKVTASASATLDLSNLLTSTYDTYLLRGVNLYPATNTVIPNIRVGTGATPTWQTGANYASNIIAYSTTATGGRESAQAQISLIAGASFQSANTGSFANNFQLYVDGSQNSSLYTVMQGPITCVNSSHYNAAVVCSTWETTTVVTSLRFYYSSGNVASGELLLYGIKKS